MAVVMQILVWEEVIFDVILCPWGSNSAALEKYNTCVNIVYIYILNKSNIKSDKISFPE